MRKLICSFVLGVVLVGAVGFSNLGNHTSAPKVISPMKIEVIQPPV
ncbi:hypothetical protein JOC77_003572 [Peribacillus deserti]|uniref:Phosphatase n=1 Tax=Peribacillus deserti TaxID=673318 RepID=A0ABS2QLS4_9BACI|nr:hypothetical protein [Peribacillus deserti]MBM7694128.1 hypothetical protein [Peribacillus deserti]